MPIAEWENVYQLIAPNDDDLILNDHANANGLGYFLTSRDNAEAGTDIRSTGDPVPQGFGTIWHRCFANGYVVTMPIELWVDQNQVANCTTTPSAQLMLDNLLRFYRRMMDGGGRILYNPSNSGTRLLDALYAIDKPVVVEGVATTTVTLRFGSEFPYMVDFDQNDDFIDSGSPTITLTNDGSSPMYPVFKVYGAFDDFVLANTTTGAQIVYDDTLPGAVSVGGGDHIEILTFRNTVYLNGSGASRKAGIDIETSEFFALEVGDNALQITSSGTAPTVEILWAPAWF